jgi:DNA-binding transcriptional regulator YdaS (Cro superfamily)
MTYEHCDYPIGVNEIATLLDVKPSTVSQWGVRKNLPPVDALV